MTERPVEPQRARAPDVRVGSMQNGLSPVSIAERSLGAGLVQWVSLTAIALAAIAADQLTKQIVTSQLSLDDATHVVGPFWIHHVQNSGIAFGLFSSKTAAVIVLTGIAVAWMLIFFARSGSRHPVLPVALGLVIGGSLSQSSRPRPARLRDGLPRPPLLARLQPRRQLHRHRRRDPPHRAARFGAGTAPVAERS